MKDIFATSGTVVQCPDPNVWLVIGFAVGVWVSFVVYIVYTRSLCKDTSGDDE